PVWGATVGKVYVLCRNILISIHAPRVGCDRSRYPQPSSSDYFNPRTPCGVRPWEVRQFITGEDISIHAPRVGCDAPPEGGGESLRDFNPRTPCGVRRF